MEKRIRPFLGFLTLLLPLALLSQSPVELGEVNWLRSYDQALLKSSETGKPVFILFQEVPGCSTCRNYGKEVLSHPVITEVIENEFVPLAVYNNKKGADARILALYNEPSWNNPVVRIVDGNGKNLVERLAGQYHAHAVLAHMVSALEIGYRPIPPYLRIWSQEMLSLKKDIREGLYSMYCFWTGEAAFGKLDGIIETIPVWAGFREAVLLRYDESLISKKELDQYAGKQGFEKLRGGIKTRPDKDPQYYLKQSDYRFLALSPLQKSRINSALAEQQNAENFMSPSQLEYYGLIRSNTLRPGESLYAQDFFSAWDKMINAL